MDDLAYRSFGQRYPARGIVRRNTNPHTVHMKWRFIAGLSVVLALLVSGCSVSGPEKPPATMSLTITSQDWNGWDPGSSYEPVTESMQVVAGESVELPGLGTEGITFTVTAVTDHSATISLSDSLWTEDSSFDDHVSSFNVELGNPVKLSTPTMDAGTNYTVTLTPL